MRHDKFSGKSLWGTIAGALTAALLVACIYLGIFAALIALFCLAAL